MDAWYRWHDHEVDVFLKSFLTPKSEWAARSDTQRCGERNDGDTGYLQNDECRDR